MNAFLLSFGVIFIAEIGDKSQLMALAFATRYRAITVLLAISHGHAPRPRRLGPHRRDRGPDRPANVMSIAAGLAFFAFAAWTLRGDRLNDADEDRATRTTGSVALGIGVAFFLAELGDKTMLATITLATTNEPIGVWLGSTAGMVAADAIAIGIGALLGARLPERAIRIGASLAFVAFGVILIAEGLGWL